MGLGVTGVGGAEDREAVVLGPCVRRRGGDSPHVCDRCGAHPALSRHFLHTAVSVRSGCSWGNHWLL